MKINYWPLEDAIDSKSLSYKSTGCGTTFHVDIKFRKKDEIYHIAQQYIDLCGGLDEELDREGSCYVNYSDVEFSVDAIDLNQKEITDILVSFLAHHKLYLHHFNIRQQGTYVSYATPESDSDKIFDLTYQPAYRSNSIHIDALVQLEDGIDYYDFLGVKLKEPVEKISYEEIEKLGYKFNESGIYGFAILDEKNAEKYLKLRSA